MNSQTIREAHTSWFTAAFLAGAALMVASIVFVRPATGWLANRYTKQTAPIRRPLKQFDFSAMPSFRQGWVPLLHQAPEEDIGTQEYLLGVMTRQDGTAPGQPSLFVTFYNDPRDKVPHTPDVCWRQAGYVVKRMTTLSIPTPLLAPQQPSVETVLIILQRDHTDVINFHVFLAEGRFLSSRNQVRWQIARPGNTHTYFSKVEVAIRIPEGTDPSAAIELGKQVMSESLFVLLRDHFPTSEQIQRRESKTGVSGPTK